MISKTLTELRNDITTELNNKLPNLDLTPGSPEADLFVEAPISGQLITLWNNLIYSAKMSSPLVYYNDLLDVDIENYCLNFNIIRRAGSYSTGTVTFYTTSEPTQDIVIPSGTKIVTAGSPSIEFITTVSYTILYVERSNYYNATLGRWSIDASVRASLLGPDYKAGTNTVTIISTSIPGIQSVTNSAIITGGTTAETNISMLRRVIETFQGRGLSSTQGLTSFLKNYTPYINVVNARNSVMVRDEGLGGMIDIYIIGSTTTTVTDTLAITSTGLTDVTSKYTSNSVTLTYQPVIALTSLYIDDVIVPSTYYTLTADTGILKGSTLGYDKLTLTSTGLINRGFFADGDAIDITYSYNSLLHTITTALDSSVNAYMNRDYLLRQMTAVTVAVYMRLRETDGNDFDTLKPTWELLISDFITSIKNTGNLEIADVVGIVKVQPTVDNIDLTTVAFTNTGGGTKTAQGDIVFGNNEYPIPGVITLVPWV